MTKLAQTLRALLDGFPHDRTFALVGGLAVSARTEPRFTRDLDFAIAVETLEHATMDRLATVRLRQHPRAPFVDLLFASCGVEPEIVSAASPLEILGMTVAVATVRHLIAMKLVSRDPKRRPRDQQDLVELARVADVLDWRRAEAAVALIQQRGFRRDGT